MTMKPPRRATTANVAAILLYCCLPMASSFKQKLAYDEVCFPHAPRPSLAAFQMTNIAAAIANEIKDQVCGEAKAGLRLLV